MTHDKRNYLMDSFQMYPIEIVVDLAKDLSLSGYVTPVVKMVLEIYYCVTLGQTELALFLP